MIDPVTGAIGASIVGSLATSAFNVFENRRNRQFQKRMSDTEMQRRVKDLRAAGINPMLAVGGHGLGGASVPTSAAAQAENPIKDPLLPLQVLQAQAGIQETKARTAKELADIGKTKSETQFLNESMEDRLFQERISLLHELDKQDLTKAEHERIVDELVLNEQHYEILKNQATHSALDLDRMRAESSMYKALGGFASAGKAGLLRIPSVALRRARLLRGIGKGAKGIKIRKVRGKFRRVDIETGEILD